jgi:hypothetical protein
MIIVNKIESDEWLNHSKKNNDINNLNIEGVIVCVYRASVQRYIFSYCLNLIINSFLSSATPIYICPICQSSIELIF